MEGCCEWSEWLWVPATAAAALARWAAPSCPLALITKLFMYPKPKPRAVAMGVGAGVGFCGAGERGDTSCGGGAKTEAVLTGCADASSNTKLRKMW